MVAHLPWEQGVAGSNPAAPTKYKTLIEWASGGTADAPDSKSGGETREGSNPSLPTKCI